MDQCQIKGNFIGLLCLLLFSLMSFSGCLATSSNTTKTEADIQLLDKRLNELNTKLDEIYHRVSVIQFSVDNHERSLQGLEKDVQAVSHVQSKASPTSISSSSNRATPENKLANKLEANKDSQLSPSPEMDYHQAFAAYKNNQFDMARKSFNAFVKKFPRHDLADNALYWSGECLYSQKKYADAILDFKQVVMHYPDGSKVPDALLKIGFAYLGKEDLTNARIYLKKVIKRYPFSLAGEKAEQKLQQINN